MSYIGHNVESGATQPLDPTLSALAALDASPGSVTQTAPDTFNKTLRPDHGFSIQATVAANALTVTLNPCILSFRSTTLNDGSNTVVNLTAPVSMTVSSGSTLGTANNISARLIVLALNNAGTVELAIVNLSGGLSLDEASLISTTAEGGAGAADAANVIYSTTARTNLPFVVVGFIDITEATVGTWLTAPTRVQSSGGQALSAMASIGYGQTWQNVIGSRVAGTIYTNNTSRPILVSIDGNTGSGICYVAVNGVNIGYFRTSGYGLVFVVPVGGTYQVTNSPVAATINLWAELR